MKKNVVLLITFIVFSIILNGCNHNNQVTNQQSKLLNNTTGYLEPKSENEILKGTTFSGITISGFFCPIIVSGNLVRYSGLVTFQIPNNFNKREYYRSPKIINTKETIGLIINSKTDLIIETTLINTGDEIHILCDQKNKEGRTYKSEKNMILNGHEIQITKQIFNEMEEIKQTNICFVKNNVIYNIRRFNNTFNEDKILNSINFNTK